MSCAQSNIFFIERASMECDGQFFILFSLIVIFSYFWELMSSLNSKLGKLVNEFYFIIYSIQRETSKLSSSQFSPFDSYI